MNISTGGPHILLFERDQQLAALLNSELQLAGYEGHTARTAVEVFDAIARYPMRLVLVNMAQAAAARREFWVALDTQRRGSSIQVLTFRCTNLAGYGPQDPDDHTSAVDIEVDGMLGLMGLVDAVRGRVPGAEGNASTMPRIPRAPNGGQYTPGQMMAQRSAQQPQQPGAGSTYSGSGSTYRNPPSRDGLGNQSSPRATAATLPQTPPINTTGAGESSAHTTSPLYTSPPSAPGGNETNQGGYSEKIRAVLYPNQRSWNTQGGNTTTPLQDTRSTQDAQNSYYAQPSTNAAPTDASVLQRLADGQTGMEGMKESGLAQLSRLVQEHRALSPAREEASAPSYTRTEPTQFENSRQARAFPTHEQVTQNSGPLQNSGAVNYAQPVRPPGSSDNIVATYVPPTPRPTLPPENPAASYAPPAPRTAQPVENRSGTYVPPSPRPAAPTENTTVSYTPPASRPGASGGETIGSRPLRASPIQDIPIERPGVGQGTVEGAKRPDVLARANYSQQASQTPVQALASIATPMPAAPPPARVTPPTPAEPDSVEEAQNASQPLQTVEEPMGGEREQVYAQQAVETQREEKLDEATVPNNAVILDILQSLPAMPAVSQQQGVQPQVLTGRATRTLGSVLLDGHLVPQDRLEVAQNIQRMLRGVDLNYQLGEILLMFKLLTPDQLLAASLVSYGLITTTQISALGRIRQELHAIGLEYDLENLLILFRILTPEQLREVRLSLQS